MPMGRSKDAINATPPSVRVNEDFPIAERFGRAKRDLRPDQGLACRLCSGEGAWVICSASTGESGLTVRL